MIKVTILQRLRNVRFSENFACFFFLLPPFRDSLFCLITGGVSNCVLHYVHQIVSNCKGDLGMAFYIHHKQENLFFFLVNITLLHGHDKECLKIWKNCTISHVYSQYVFLCLRVFNNGCSNPSFIAGPENSFIVPVIIRVYCKDFKETLKIRFR